MKSAARCIVLLLTASAALAQALPSMPYSAPEPAPSWGVTDETAVNVGSFEMVPYTDGIVINTVLGTAKRYVASSTVGIRWGSLPLDLPRGATITRIEADACNDNAEYWPTVKLFNFSTDYPNDIAVIPIPPQSGCGTFSSDPVSHEVGLDGPYTLIWNQNVHGPTQTLSMVRVYYKLQVSAAPATATFGDVPVGDPLHQYVEALVAAGITAGCGEGNYCPNASITRGQMAVFLAKALGLHWAP